MHSNKMSRPSGWSQLASIFHYLLMMSILGLIIFVYQRISVGQKNIEELIYKGMVKASKSALSNEQTSSLSSSSISSQNLPSMYEIGKKVSSDKVIYYNFDRYYPMYLEHLRKSPIKMLEIGYLLGQSYKMWVEYFPKGIVYFMEKDFGRSFPEARFTGDQGNNNSIVIVIFLLFLFLFITRQGIRY